MDTEYIDTSFLGHGMIVPRRDSIVAPIPRRFISVPLLESKFNPAEANLEAHRQSVFDGPPGIFNVGRGQGTFDAGFQQGTFDYDAHPGTLDPADRQGLFDPQWNFNNRAIDASRVSSAVSPLSPRLIEPEDTFIRWEHSEFNPMHALANWDDFASTHTTTDWGNLGHVDTPRYSSPISEDEFLDEEEEDWDEDWTEEENDENSFNDDSFSNTENSFNDSNFAAFENRIPGPENRGNRAPFTVLMEDVSVEQILDDLHFTFMQHDFTTLIEEHDAIMHRLHLTAVQADREALEFLHATSHSVAAWILDAMDDMDREDLEAMGIEQDRIARKSVEILDMQLRDVIAREGSTDLRNTAWQALLDAAKHNGHTAQPVFTRPDFDDATLTAHDLLDHIMVEPTTSI
ncbi:hypothetical protein C8J56DRAFT_883234 [Mycena floridula]|nr:hypothetical protein C8J56DRAFT_883234 [Mycena floridula]